MDIDESTKQGIIDEEHLRLLSFFHYISGALTIAFSSMFIFHLVFLSYIRTNPDKFAGEAGANVPPAEMFDVFISILSVFVLMGISFGLLQILSGWFIKKRKGITFSTIIAIFCLIMFPFGTLLGVFTLIVLGRRSIKEKYAFNLTKGSN